MKDKSKHARNVPDELGDTIRKRHKQVCKDPNVAIHVKSKQGKNMYTLIETCKNTSAVNTRKPSPMQLQRDKYAEKFGIQFPVSDHAFANIIDNIYSKLNPEKSILTDFILILGCSMDCFVHVRRTPAKHNLEQKIDNFINNWNNGICQQLSKNYRVAIKSNVFRLLYS